MGLFLLLLPFAEIYLLYTVGVEVGFLPLLAFLILSGFVGMSIMRTQSSVMMAQFQQQLNTGKLPPNQMLKGPLIFVGGLLLMIPGLITKTIGLLLILPGTRFLASLVFRKLLAQQISKGRVHVFSSGGGFAWGSRPSAERDVSPQIIDVTPLPAREIDKNKPSQD
jgi:UPF0716 protein FxsA